MESDSQELIDQDLSAHNSRNSYIRNNRIKNIIMLPHLKVLFSDQEVFDLIDKELE